MMFTYAAQMRGLLADHDTSTGLIWEMWVNTRPLMFRYADTNREIGEGFNWIYFNNSRGFQEDCKVFSNPLTVSLSNSIRRLNGFFSLSEFPTQP